MNKDRHIYAAPPVSALLCRVGNVVLEPLGLLVMLFREDRARFYSYFHRVWLKNSYQLVWIVQPKDAAGDFF
ncbi:MAG: DUF2517 family protein [Candidatus Malihini olakiniferum]